MKFFATYLLVIFFAFLSYSNLSGQGSGTSLTMDGDDYVEINSSAGDELDPSDQITLECWVYLTEAPSGTHRPHVISKNFAYALVVDLDASVRFFVYDTDFRAVSTPASVIGVNQWYHICGTFNTTDDSLKVYVNGVLMGETSITVGSINQQDSLVRIGTRLLSNSSQFLRGSVDEVRIWNVERTQSQIRSTMTTRLTGNESGLAGYWRLDDGSGTVITDSSPFANTGTLKTIGASLASWTLSGAAIGDASNYLFTTSWSGQSVSISHSDGDVFTVSNVTGTPDGVFVYRVDEAPNNTNVPTGSGWDKLDPLRYWGVFISGGTTPTLDVEYNYQGHPGIVDETTLAMARRSNNADNAWVDAGATLNTLTHTLTVAGETTGEFILASQSTDNSLPVEMMYFQVISENGHPTLLWETGSENQNIGFEIFRKKANDPDYKLIASYRTNSALRGLGNSSVGKKYQYTDTQIPDEEKYYYVLESVDFTGNRERFGPVEYVASSDHQSLQNFVISDNYPNPFNPVTRIQIKSDRGMTIDFQIRNVLGQVVYSEKDRFIPQGITNLVWNAASYPSGIYFYTIIAKDGATPRILKTGKMLYIE